MTWFGQTQKDSVRIWILRWQDHEFDHCTKGWNFYIKASNYQVFLGWSEITILHEITDNVLQHNIPDELIINVDQKPSKFVATENISMTAKGEEHISRAEETDKRAKTATLCKSLDGCMLLSQPIYIGKTERSLPDFTFPDGLCLAFNQKNWSNETETTCLIEDLLVPYIKKVKEEKALSQPKKSLLIWDAFKAQSTSKVMDTLLSDGIESVMVPRSMTHLLQPQTYQQTHPSKIMRNELSVNIPRLVLWKL